MKLRDHPHDNPVSAGLRFAVEVIAWIAGPWAAAGISFWLWVPAALVLFGLPARTLSVTETIQRVKGRGLVSLAPKTDRSRRSVSLPPDAVALLSGLKVKQREEREAFGMVWTESDYVFSHIDGRPFHPDTVSHTFADIVKKAGFPHLRLHDLRHTHATMMMEMGVNPKIVSERLGHASVVITLDTYSHVSPGLQEEAALKFGEGLRQRLRNGIAQDL